ncbi:class A beta-lactamase [Mucilaginibacter corticis]|uniref:Beta-lactamase n=1 Tax=Mucilaginibacter corticis TaxID=2597670 RepID=A0A556MI75_9SPHI|nr:class A beta-lactamase [Mucilaginibacter corticis]TSJ39569.1 class A beta-lactamase [Mucilaginibacter corticis]
MTTCKSLLVNISFALVFLFQTNLSFGQNVLQAKIGQCAKNANGNVGVYALVLETGETVSYNGDKKFPMQSVYKFPIAMAVLDRVDKKQLSLNKKISVTKADYIAKIGHSPLRDKFPNGTDIAIKDLVKYSVSESDGSASDVLVRLLGGTKFANEYVHRLGVKDIAIATTEKIQVENDTIQYQNWATPKAMTSLLNIFYTRHKLSASSRAVLLNDMITSTPGAKRLKGLLPVGTIVAHKTGTAGTFNGLTRATNDAGIITLPNGKHLAITVFIADSHSSEEIRELTIAKIGKAAFDYWGGGK